MTEVQKKRHEAAQKAAQTAREHREKWKERERERREELAAANYEPQRYGRGPMG